MTIKSIVSIYEKWGNVPEKPVHFESIDSDEVCEISDLAKLTMANCDFENKKKRNFDNSQDRLSKTL